MNICLLCRNFHKDSGGIETFTCEMAKALALSGHTIDIILVPLYSTSHKQ